MEAFQDFEDKVTCPYDKAHSIRKSRMGVHLVKCAKNHQDAEMVTCDFNTTHRISRPMLRHHHETCPDRRKIEDKIIQQDDEDPSKIYPIQQVHVEVEEYWDDVEHPTYDPAAYCAENNVLRHMDVQSASKRRNFRLEERERLNRFRDAASARPDDDNDERNRQSAVAFRPPSAVNVRMADSARMTAPNLGARTATTTEHEGQVPTNTQHISTVSVEEDAAHFSLVDRIKRGNKKTYEPKH